MSTDGLRGSRAPGSETRVDSLIRYHGIGDGENYLTASAQHNSKRASLDDAGLFQSLGNIVTGNLDYARSIESAMRAERVSAREAEKNRRWQEQMSNTAYSRAIADLKRNGINPYAIGYFSPASTPAGATGSAYNTSPHSAASNALGALGLVERAYDNIQRRKIDKETALIRLIATILES